MLPGYIHPHVISEIVPFTRGSFIAACRDTSIVGTHQLRMIRAALTNHPTQLRIAPRRLLPVALFLSAITVSACAEDGPYWADEAEQFSVNPDGTMTIDVPVHKKLGVKRGTEAEVVWRTRPKLTAVGYLPEKDPNYVRHFVGEDGVVFFYFEGRSPLKSGMAIAGSDYLGRVVQVLALEDTAKFTHAAKLADATLDDVFSDLDFELHRPPPKPLSEVTNIGNTQVSLGGGGKKSGDQNCETKVCSNVGAVDLSAATKEGSEQSDGPVCYPPEEENGPEKPKICNGYANAGLTFEHHFQASADARFHVKLIKGTLLFQHNNLINVGASIRAWGTAGVTCAADFAKMINGGESPRWTLLKVVVLGIPVDIYAEPILDARLDINATAAGVAYINYSRSAHRKIGLEKLKWVNEKDVNESFDAVISGSAAVSVTGEIRAGLEVGASVGLNLIKKKGKLKLGATADLYGRVWASLGVDASAHVSASGSASNGLNTSCNYSVDVPWSVNAQAGARVRIKAWRLVDKTWQVDTGVAKIASGSLASFSGSCDGVDHDAPPDDYFELPEGLETCACGSPESWVTTRAECDRGIVRYFRSYCDAGCKLRPEEESPERVDCGAQGFDCEQYGNGAECTCPEGEGECTEP